MMGSLSPMACTRVTKASVVESHGNTTTHYVRFVKQLSVESPRASDNEDETLAVKDGEESYQAHNQKQKNTIKSFQKWSYSLENTSILQKIFVISGALKLVFLGVRSSRF